jgi:hypothetical protein
MTLSIVTLRIIQLYIVVLSMLTLSMVTLSIVTLSIVGTTVSITHSDNQYNGKLTFAVFHYYAVFRNTECHYAKCRGAKMPASIQVGNSEKSLPRVKLSTKKSHNSQHKLSTLSTAHLG